MEPEHEDALRYEVEIVWDKIDEDTRVREEFVKDESPHGEPSHESLVGYGVISSHAPYSDDEGRYVRRIFVKDEKGAKPEEIEVGEPIE